MRYIDKKEFDDLVQELLLNLEKLNVKKIFGIPRNGCIVALALEKHGMEIVQKPEDAQALVDDVVETGRTFKEYMKYKTPLLSLVIKKPGDEWIKWWFEKPDQK